MIRPLSQLVFALALIRVIAGLPTNSQMNTSDNFTDSPLDHQGSQDHDNFELTTRPVRPVIWTSPTTGWLFEVHPLEQSSMRSNERLDCLSRARARAATDIRSLGVDYGVENSFWWYQYGRTRIDVDGRAQLPNYLTFGDVYTSLDGVHDFFERYSAWHWKARIDIFRGDGSLVAHVYLLPWEPFTNGEPGKSDDQNVTVVEREIQASTPGVIASKRDSKPIIQTWTDELTAWRFTVQDWNRQVLDDSDRDEVLDRALRQVSQQIQFNDAKQLIGKVTWIYRFHGIEVNVVDDSPDHDLLNLEEIQSSLAGLQRFLNQHVDWHHSVQASALRPGEQYGCNVILRPALSIDSPDSITAGNVTALAKRQDEEAQIAAPQLAVPMSWTDPSNRWRYYVSDYSEQIMVRWDRDALIESAIDKLSDAMESGVHDPSWALPWKFSRGRDEIVIVFNDEKLSYSEMRSSIRFIQSILIQFPEWDYAVKTTVLPPRRQTGFKVFIRTYMDDGRQYQDLNETTVTEFSERLQDGRRRRDLNDTETGHETSLRWTNQETRWAYVIERQPDALSPGSTDTTLIAAIGIVERLARVHGSDRSVPNIPWRITGFVAMGVAGRQLTYGNLLNVLKDLRSLYSNGEVSSAITFGVMLPQSDVQLNGYVSRRSSRSPVEESARL